MGTELATLSPLSGPEQRKLAMTPEQQKQYLGALENRAERAARRGQCHSTPQQVADALRAIRDGPPISRDSCNF